MIVARDSVCTEERYKYLIENGNGHGIKMHVAWGSKSESMKNLKCFEEVGNLIRHSKRYLESREKVIRIYAEADDVGKIMRNNVINLHLKKDWRFIDWDIIQKNDFEVKIEENVDALVAERI